MRIVGGSLGGQRLGAGVPRGTRPTSDRVREALASALQSRGAFDEVRVLDLFAGSGALGLEAISRGASDVLAVDQAGDAVRAIRRNASTLGVEAQVQTHRLDLLAPPERVAERLLAMDGGPFGLLLLDPPYAVAGRCDALIDALWAAGLLAPDAVVALEHASAHPPPQPSSMGQPATYRYGDTAIALFSPAG